jgi:hypothetical protein
MTDRLTKTGFARQVAAAWRAQPHVTHVFVNEQAFEIELRYTPEPAEPADLATTTFHLDSFYAEYLRHGDIPHEVERMLGSLIDFGTPRQRTLEDVRVKLLPKLEPLYQVQAAEKERPIRRLYRHWQHGLVITYVVDGAQSVRYLTEDDCNFWDVTQREIHAIAVNNFIHQKLTDDVAFEVEGDQERLIMCEVKDGYAATRALFPSWIRSRLAGVLTLTPYVAIPQRDMLIVADIASSRSKQTFKQLARHLYDGFAHRYRQTPEVWSIADERDIQP